MQLISPLQRNPTLTKTLHSFVSNSALSTPAIGACTLQRIARRHRAPIITHPAAIMSTGSLQYAKPIVNSPSSPTAAVIILHGLGDSGHGWADVGQQLKSALPHVRFIFPHAPERPITLNMGFVMPGWYDIQSLEGINRKEDEAGIQESAWYVDQLVADQAKDGIPADRVVVAGFSQGGAVALYTLRGQTKLAGVAGLSTYMPLHDKPPIVSEANAQTPVFMAHGDADNIVQYQYGQASFEELKSAGAQVEFKTYHGMGHSACPQELQDLARFLETVLPSSSS